MQAADMVLALERYFGRTLPQAQAEVIVSKLQRFADDQLDQIFQRAVEDCKYLFARGANPAAQLFDVARDLGFLAASVKTSAVHTWTKTDCSYCAGSGMVAVFSELFTDEDKSLKRREKRLLPYQSGAATDYRYEHPEEEQALAKCSCPAGGVSTLPRGWTRLGQVREHRESSVTEYGFRQAGDYRREETMF